MGNESVIAGLPMLNRLCKWRVVLAGWHAGTKSISEPGTQAMRDLMDKWLIMRCENSALVGLLVQKGVFTAAELTAAVEGEAALLDGDMEKIFPGFRSSPTGMIIEPKLAAETMRKKGFPP